MYPVILGLYRIVGIPYDWYWLLVLDLEFTGVCIMVFYYTGQIDLEWITILVDLILGFIDGLLLGSARLLLPECLTRD